MRDITAQIEKAAREHFFETGALDPGALVYYPEVREICAGNGCGNYGKSWACPPAVGTLAECRERIGQYENMLLFSSKYDLEDSFDFEGMHASLHKFKQTVASFRSDIQKLLPRYLLLSNEGCGQCETCTYPHAPCRFPERLCHSLEGYGFLVSELAKSAGMHYHNGTNTVTYFGALLF